MLYQKILVPFDGSEHAQRAVQEAIRIASLDPATQIKVITVLVGSQTANLYGGFTGEITSVDPTTIMKLHEERMSQLRDKVTTDASPLFEGVPNPVTYDATFAASPAEGIVDIVNEEGFDLVVMGCRGLGAIRGALGSVSYGVLRLCEVPVLTVK